MIKKAAHILKKGGVVAFATETVYGLGADALNAKAVARIFKIKKRPYFDPLIVHLDNSKKAFSLCSRIPAPALKLAKKFWPGPLTMVLPKKKIVPDIVTGGLDTVALRVPSHKTALELIRLSGVPIAAPSANLFGRTSPTTAQAVYDDLGRLPDMILDSGSCSVGVESTVIEVKDKYCILLRPGGISLEALKKIVKIKILNHHKRNGVLSSPGLLKSHYAPRQPMVLLESNKSSFEKQMNEFEIKFKKMNKKWPRIAYLSWIPEKKNPLLWKQVSLSRSGDDRQAAVKLFETIRKIDKMSPDLIVAEPVPVKGLGLAIMDRLLKASSGHRELGFFMEKCLKQRSVRLVQLKKILFLVRNCH